MKSTFIRKIIDCAVTNSGKTAVVDENGKNRVSYGELLTLALKVSRYIKQQNPEKDRFVCINMEKSAKYLACELGTWLAGCTAVPISNTYPEERVNYIANHCSASITLNQNSLGAIIDMAPDSPTLPDSSSNALLIYTSGSTGNPKGILHTFNTLDNMVTYPLIPGLDMKSVKYASGAPFTFALAVRSWSVLAEGGEFHILDNNTVKSPQLLADYVKDYAITVCNISPSAQKFFKNKSPELKIVFGGGEKYTTQYSKDGYVVWSDYGQSETISAIANFQLPDHPMENVPLGKCNPSFKYRIIDEQGNDVPQGEVGELILKGPLFKEYFKEPELTAEAIIDGWLHTKDLVYQTPTEELVFVNRKDWMIKINGQRVEPGEIEYSMRRIPGIKDALVKDFTRNDGSVYICAYYISEKEIPREQMVQSLQSQLNSYMIPSYFVKIDEFPTLPNGKLDRKSLTAPDFDNFRAEYTAPENERQEIICKAMASVLGLEKIGILDDFFALGGDSILCMKLCSCLKENNLNCSVRLIYGNSTPKALDNAINDSKSEEKMDTERFKDQYPLPYQSYYLDYQLYSPNQCVANNIMYLKMNRQNVDPYKLKDVVNKAVKHYANLSSVFTYNDQSDLVFRYRPDLIEEIELTETTEEKIEKVHKQEFCKTFGIINCRMCRMHIYCTSEHTYLFWDNHHSVFDGSAQKALLKAIFDNYNGIDFPEDRYFEYLKRIHDTELSDNGQTVKILREKYGDFENYNTYPTPDCESLENKYGCIVLNSGYSNSDIEDAADKKKVSMTCAITAAGLLGMSRYNKNKRTAAEWIYNGRDEAWKEELVGLTISAMPVYADFNNIVSTDSLLKEVHSQMTQQMKYADYSYAVRYISPCKKENMKIVYDLGVDLPENAPEGTEVSMDFLQLNGSGCIFQCIVKPGKKSEPFCLVLTGNAIMYSQESMVKIGNTVLSALEDCLGLKPKPELCCRQMDLM